MNSRLCIDTTVAAWESPVQNRVALTIQLGQPRGTLGELSPRRCSGLGGCRAIEFALMRRNVHNSIV